MATIDWAVRIEPGTLDDLDDVMRIMTAAFGNRYGEAWTRSQCAGILPMAKVSLRLARDGETGGAIGFSLSRTVADESELLLLAVSPARQRQGVGRRLLDDFMDRAGGDGVARVHLEVRDGNPAVGMYLAAGFDSVGRRANYYHGAGGIRFDALTFAHKL